MRLAAPLALLLALASPALANREGFENARQKSERLERRGEWAAAAAWWEAAAETMECVSAPLSELGVKEAREDGDVGAEAWWRKYGEEDARLAKEARERAAAAWKQAGGANEAARRETRDFLALAIAQYPENFWRWGGYERRADSLRSSGNEIGAWELEARGRERWAARYRAVCEAYWTARDAPERAGEFAAKAAEQERRAAAVRERIAEERRGEGWDADALRQQLRGGTPQEARDAVSRLAFLGHLEGLREALSHAEPEVGRRAFAALAERRDAEGLRLAAACAREAVRAEAAKTGNAAGLRGDPEWAGAFLRALRDPAAAAALRGFAAERLGLPADLAAGDDWQKSAPARLAELAALARGRFQPGLRAEFFAAPEPGGDGRRQILEEFDCDWGLDAPVAGLGADGWSLRAHGYLVVEEEMVAELLVQCDDAIRVRLDARPVIDEWCEAPEPQFRRAPVRLEKGLHSIAVEYGDRSGLATLRLWLAPARDAVVPLGPLLRRAPEEK